MKGSRTWEEKSCCSAWGSDARSRRGSSAERPAGFAQSSKASSEQAQSLWGPRVPPSPGDKCPRLASCVQAGSWSPSPLQLLPLSAPTPEQSLLCPGRGQGLPQEPPWGLPWAGWPMAQGEARATKLLGWASLAAGVVAWTGSLPRAARSSPREPRSLPVPDLQDVLQLQEPGGGRAEHQHLQHVVHGIQGLQGGREGGGTPSVVPPPRRRVDRTAVAGAGHPPPCSAPAEASGQKSCSAVHGPAHGRCPWPSTGEGEEGRRVGKRS